MNDIKLIDECIRDIQGCCKKEIYITSTKLFKYVEYVIKCIKDEEEKLEKLANDFSQTNMKVTTMDKIVRKMFDAISILQKERDGVLEIFALL